MNPPEQEANRAFLELASAFEQFRQAWEKAMAARQPAAAERHVEVRQEQPTPTKKLLTRREAAEYLGLTPQTLAAWHVDGRYSLPIVKVGRSVRYRSLDLERWLESRTRGKATR